MILRFLWAVKDNCGSRYECHKGCEWSNRHGLFCSTIRMPASHGRLFHVTSLIWPSVNVCKNERKELFSIESALYSLLLSILPTLTTHNVWGWSLPFLVPVWFTVKNQRFLKNENYPFLLMLAIQQARTAFSEYGHHRSSPLESEAVLFIGNELFMLICLSSQMILSQLTLTRLWPNVFLNQSPISLSSWIGVRVNCRMSILDCPEGHLHIVVRTTW